MGGLSPATMPNRATLRGIARAGQSHIVAGSGGRTDGSGCIISVGAYTRVRNGKLEQVGGHQRSNPDCGEDSPDSVVRISDRADIGSRRATVFRAHDQTRRAYARLGGSTQPDVARADRR
jgi:hypothetical protein